MDYLKRFLFVLAPVLLLASCGGTDSEGGDGDGFTVSLTDTGLGGDNFIALAFSGNAFKSKTISVLTATPLENGNTVSVSGLSSGTEYDIFFWIDTNTTPDTFEKGTYLKIYDIGADVGFETAFYSFFNKDVNITSGIDGTAHCMWLIKDTLDTVVSRETLYTDSGRANTHELVGFVNATINSGSGTGDAALYDWPLHTPGGFFVQYDLFCIIDAGSPGIRDVGIDYEGFIEDIDADVSAQAINLSAAL